jgi:hypothetical protein
MEELECPECKTWNKVPDDCYDPDTHYECECSKCSKIFGFTLEYYPTYTTYSTPCANGEPHKWKPKIGFPAEFFKGQQFCEYCGEGRTVQEEAGRTETTSGHGMVKPETVSSE